MAISNFNPAENIQYSSFNQDRLSDRDRFLIETLLADSGIYGAYQGAVAAPTPSPTPTAPAPSPSPSPSPTPGAAASQQDPITVNTFVQLALSEVNPGDLITAAFANKLIKAVLALETRVKALEGMGRTTQTSTPTPSQSTPAPTPGGGASLVGNVRSEIGRAAPTIESVTGETVRGKGVDITVTGDNLGEGVVERVLLGATVIAAKGIKYTRTGFAFTTTATVVKNAKNRITVVTSGGEDSAPITSGKKAPVL